MRSSWTPSKKTDLNTPIVIGSRGSRLALWQANHVQSVLTAHGHSSEIKIIQTRGDRIQDLSFDKLEGKGFFTKEIEAALLSGEIDLAVHSHKDLETSQPEGLGIAAVSARADHRDVLVIRNAVLDPAQRWGLPEHARVGTSSARRKGQLHFYRPDVQTVDIRGNVPTRLRKLFDEGLDAIVLAKAGLDRLELVPEDAQVVPLDPKAFVPAPAQGALAIQIREDEQALRDVLQVLNDDTAKACTELEREILAGLDGGCQLPFGASAIQNGDRFELDVAYAPEVDAPLRMLHLSGTAQDQLAQQALHWLKGGAHPTPAVYLSRHAKDAGHLPDMFERWSIPFEAQSQIEIRTVKGALPEGPFDWVFFSSRNAVDAFFAQHALLSGQKVGAIGPGTARKLERHCTLDFVGKGTETDQTAHDFAAHVGDASVLFAVGNRSRRTVQAALPAEQVTELTVYETAHVPQRVETPEIAVFTSPSNVEAFAEANAFAPGIKTIAAGRATAQALQSKGVEPSAVLTSMSSAAVARAIFTEMLGL